MALQGSTQMDMMDYLRQYGGEVKNRVMNPGRTLATALQEGMPTEQNPLGMFGAGALTKMHGLPNVFKTKRKEMPDWKYDEPKSAIPEGFKAAKDNQVIQLPDGTKMFKLQDGSYTDTTGKLMFPDLKALFEHVKNPPPEVMRSNRPSSPFYKDPFTDTTQ